MFVSFLFLFLLVVPFLTILVTPYSKLFTIKMVAFVSSLLVFLFSLVLWLFLDKISNNFQWALHFIWSDFLNIYYSGGLDGVSLLFVVLTAFLMPLCLLYSWRQFPYFFKELVLLLLSVEFFLFHFFFVSDVFFLFFLKVYFFLCLFLLVIMVLGNEKFMRLFSFLCLLW